MSDLSPDPWADRWTWRETIGELELALPKQPEERFDLDDGAGKVIVSDEFGDAFGIVEGPPEALPFAIGRALDQLYGVEWGESEAPAVEAATGELAFQAYGEDYLGRWQTRGSVILFAVVRPERRVLAEAFVGGVSVLPTLPA